MVTIYALINPFNNDPFYVGAATNINSRLSGHKLDGAHFNGRVKNLTNQRHKLIKQILDAGYLQSSKCFYWSNSAK